MIKIIRRLLVLVMLFGFLLIPVAPIARLRNEGFGDAPGPVSVSLYWQQLSYVLIPIGVVMIVAAGTAVVVIDWRR